MTTATRHFDNRPSWFSLDSTSASYQEGFPPCTRPGQLTRTRPPFEPVRPRERMENRQLAGHFGASLEDHGPNIVLYRAGP
ncbi:D-alanine--D-alanine ligase [Streptomyces populi]|uniref:D-alanine--D-alanine ligase n=1 Tax=Streptomyces populi TaxID=2058924 RepID=A0A2I0SMY8_9ACTN|nr:D-alanine--D-alanine ligase [Streptomyces populi]